MASCQSGCGGWQPVRVIPAGDEYAYDAADSQRGVACEQNLPPLPAGPDAADPRGPAIGELSSLLHFQRGGPTGPGADPKPVLAGVVRLSPLPSDDDEGVGVISEGRAGEAGARFPGKEHGEGQRLTALGKVLRQEEGEKGRTWARG